MVYYLILSLIAGFSLACYMTSGVTQVTVLWHQMLEGNSAALWAMVSITAMSILGLLVAMRGRGRVRLLAFDSICIFTLSILAFFQQIPEEGASKFFWAIMAIIQGTVYSFIPICANGLIATICLLVNSFRKSGSH